MPCTEPGADLACHNIYCENWREYYPYRRLHLDFEPEIKAMQEVHSALVDLEDNAKMRVIKWVLDKFSLNGQRKNFHDGPSAEHHTHSEEEPIDIDMD